MYIDVVPNRDSPRPCSSARPGARKENLQAHLGQSLRLAQRKNRNLPSRLRDERLVSPEDLFATQKTLVHGQVQAVLEMIGRLELDLLISAPRCANETWSWP